MTSTITPEQARRFQLLALGLTRPFSDVPAALAHHGFIQMDPINICGRMHDLILRNRVTGYREGDLLRHLYAARRPVERQAFEHYLPGQGILVTFPMEAWPWLAPHMKLRARQKTGYARKLSAAEERIAGLILRELADRGPLTSDDIEHDGRAHSGWGTPSRAVKVVLEKLFVHGRVLPEHVRQAPEPSLPDQQCWLIYQRLRQRRLVTLRKADVSVVGDLIQRVEVPGCPVLFCLREDRELLEQAGRESCAEGEPGRVLICRRRGDESFGKALLTSCPTAELGHCREPRLLAPLDPLIYDRKLTAQLWGFDYTWEVYTPPGKRTRGYYALPLLSGAELVGHVDPKADRQEKRLRVVGRKVRRGHRASPAVQALAQFLGLRV